MGELIPCVLFTLDAFIAENLGYLPAFIGPDRYLAPEGAHYAGEFILIYPV
jgi:hypothetical protein